MALSGNPPAASALHPPCSDSRGRAGLSVLWGVIRFAAVCTAIALGGGEAGASGGDFLCHRTCTVAVPQTVAGTTEPDAVPEIPALPSAAHERSPLSLHEDRLPDVVSAPVSWLSTRPIPRSPPLAIAAFAPCA